MVYVVMVTSYGYAEIEADNEKEALNKVSDMDARDFNWIEEFYPEDAKIIEEFDPYN